jgi:CheY-like chemotaxis protein
MVMPLMDGWSFLAEYKQVPEWSRIPVVIMTALGIASREWAASLGAIDVLKKPAEIEDVLESLRRQC